MRAAGRLATSPAVCHTLSGWTYPALANGRRGGQAGVGVPATRRPCLLISRRPSDNFRGLAARWFVDQAIIARPPLSGGTRFNVMPTAAGDDAAGILDRLVLRWARAWLRPRRVRVALIARAKVPWRWDRRRPRADLAERRLAASAPRPHASYGRSPVLAPTRWAGRLVVVRRTLPADAVGGDASWSVRRALAGRRASSRQRALRGRERGRNLARLRRS